MESQEQRRRTETEELIEGVLNNDPEVIRTLYHQHYDTIINMVRHFKYLSIEPEDVFQEGLTRAILNIRRGKFKGNSSFGTYLYGICHNLCLKDYERNKKTVRLRKVPQQTEEDYDDDYYERLQKWLEAKKQLDEKCVQIINLRFGIQNGSENNEMKRFDEIADKLKITAENARQRFGRCMKKLKSLINQQQ
jgi:RNA polymerase sigma factor (sigma-70 family)